MTRPTWEDVFRALEERGCETVREFGQAQCPGPHHDGHADDRLSLLVEDGPDGVALTCKDGCEQQENLRRLGLAARAVAVSSAGAPPKHAAAQPFANPDSIAPQHPTRQGEQWAWLPPLWRRLVGMLNGTEWVVLLELVSATNWSPKRQGNVRATYISDDSLSRRTGVPRPHVTTARNRIMKLRIYRDATPEEAAAVLKDQPERHGRGRRPTVRVLVDPEHWHVSPRRPFQTEE